MASCWVVGHVGFITWEVRALNTALFPHLACWIDSILTEVLHTWHFVSFLSLRSHTHACFCAQCQTQGLPRRSSCDTCF